MVNKCTPLYKVTNIIHHAQHIHFPSLTNSHFGLALASLCRVINSQKLPSTHFGHNVPRAYWGKLLTYITTTTVQSGMLVFKWKLSSWGIWICYHYIDSGERHCISIWQAEGWTNDKAPSPHVDKIASGHLDSSLPSIKAITSLLSVVHL